VVLLNNRLRLEIKVDNPEWTSKMELVAIMNVNYDRRRFLKDGVFASKKSLGRLFDRAERPPSLPGTAREETGFACQHPPCESRFCVRLDWSRMYRLLKYRYGLWIADDMETS